MTREKKHTHTHKSVTQNLKCLRVNICLNRIEHLVPLDIVYYRNSIVYRRIGIRKAMFMHRFFLSAFVYSENVIDFLKDTNSILPQRIAEVREREKERRLQSSPTQAIEQHLNCWLSVICCCGYTIWTKLNWIKAVVVSVKLMQRKKHHVQMFITFSNVCTEEQEIRNKKKNTIACEK